jgi:hypothetical protein
MSCKKAVPGVHLCKHQCKELYLYNAEIVPGVVSHVRCYFRCAKCGAEHLGQLDEHYIIKVLRESQRVGNNDNPPSCTL